MPQLQNGSLRLVRVFGIDVFVHWSWLLVAYVEFQTRDQNRYQATVWYVVEYLTIFGIVLLHEFGHALACRQVGGQANRIMLWPLGGIAYVAPPPRPGAWLWSIAAGPLVNVVLVPVSLGLLQLAGQSGWQQSAPDLYKYVQYISMINAGLLIFNLLPIYPLDGGQILQSLLWFAIGRAKSLMVVSVIGLVAGAGLVGLAILGRNMLLGIMAAFIAFRCWAGFQQARVLAQLLGGPRHEGLACPSCGQAPRKGAFWQCGRCGRQFDIFDEQGVCPGCGGRAGDTECSDCRRRNPLALWHTAPVGNSKS